MTDTEVMLAAAARTAHGAMLGSLSGARAPDRGAAAVESPLERAGVDPDDVDRVWGDAVRTGLGQVPAGPF